MYSNLRATVQIFTKETQTQKIVLKRQISKNIYYIRWHFHLALKCNLWFSRTPIGQRQADTVKVWNKTHKSVFTLLSVIKSNNFLIKETNGGCHN